MKSQEIGFEILSVMGLKDVDHSSCFWFLLVYFEGFRPEWCISSMIYSRDTPFGLETLDLFVSCQYSIKVLLPALRSLLRKSLLSNSLVNGWFECFAFQFPFAFSADV